MGRGIPEWERDLIHWKRWEERCGRRYALVRISRSDNDDCVLYAVNDMSSTVGHWRVQVSYKLDYSHIPLFVKLVSSMVLTDDTRLWHNTSVS